jgi:hypothetical protein
LSRPTCPLPPNPVVFLKWGQGAGKASQKEKKINLMFEHIQRKYNGEFRYKLAKKATTCPQCGKKRFKPYINTETGEMLPSQYGRCNRQDHCGYWLDPYKEGYGRLSPDEWKAKRAEQTKQRNYIVPKPQRTEPKPSFIDKATFNKSLAGYDNNNFVLWLRKRLGAEAANEAIRRYAVGTSKHWEGSTVFWQIDGEGRIRTGKIMLYDGEHRVKDEVDGQYPITWAHTALKLTNYNLSQCLFGLHLLKDTTAPVAIAEAEKTALVASIYKPDYVWLATGGKQNINLIEKAAGQLQGRKVILFPDLKATADWEAKAQELRSKCKIDIYVSDYLESVATEQGREQGADIADYLLQNELHRKKLTFGEADSTLRTPLPKETAEPQPAPPTEPPAVERLQPEAIKSAIEEETPAEAQETPQKRVAECSPKTQGVYYGQTFAPVWDAEIKALEAFFDSRKDNLPESVKTGHSVIVNVPLFIESHLARVKAHNGNPTFLPYLDRLTALKNLLTN